MLSTQYIILW